MPKRPGRNEPCPCGSGLKYKHCHLNRLDGSRPEDLSEAINTAAEAVTSQNAGEMRRGIDMLERLRTRADLDDIQRATIELNLAAGLQFEGQHGNALGILNRLATSTLSYERLNLWSTLSAVFPWPRPESLTQPLSA
jgi:hypothetical protein